MLYNYIIESREGQHARRILAFLPNGGKKEKKLLFFFAFF